MGRIAPRKNKQSRFSGSIFDVFKKEPRHNLRPNDEDEGDITSETGLRARLTQCWHLPDRFDWLAPLPAVHRRWLCVALLVVIVAFIWPSAPETPAVSQSASDSRTAALQAELVDNSADSQPDGNWRQYQISEGQTLAQLFRQHGLPVADVFAMAQVEGGSKPLSNLQAGQQVRVMQNERGLVTALEIETSTGKVRFDRQSDGSYQVR
ncbi:hypothetical protein EDC52_102341 [Biostraticola tofi]|uniref:Opacity-associated protein A n=2 Tax=Biostraticola tofi TaxID=466109 RepID=A0A4R3Z3X7_9GAMM|nr:hypothetical protein EDC52_102341 [Biostraticola tofi]